MNEVGIGKLLLEQAELIQRMVPLKKEVSRLCSRIADIDAILRKAGREALDDSKSGQTVMEGVLKEADEGGVQ